MSRCRSCGAPILWAITEKGRRIPLDPEPRDDGNVILRVQGVPEHGLPPLAIIAHEAGAEDARYVSHFATCPHAEEWRQ